MCLENLSPKINDDDFRTVYSNEFLPVWVFRSKLNNDCVCFIQIFVNWIGMPVGTNTERSVKFIVERGVVKKIHQFSSKKDNIYPSECHNNGGNICFKFRTKGNTHIIE